MNLHYTLKLFLQFVDINCEVITGRLPYSFEKFTQIKQKVVISSYINDIEANLPFGKNTLHVFTWHFKKIVGKNLFWCFIHVLFGFVEFCVTLNDLCCWTQRCGLLSRIQLTLTNKNWQTDPNEFVSHFEFVFVVCWP